MSWHKSALCINIEAVVVVLYWSACSALTPTIRVRFLQKCAILFVKLSEKNDSKQKETWTGPHSNTPCLTALSFVSKKVLRCWSQETNLTQIASARQKRTLPLEVVVKKAEIFRRPPDFDVILSYPNFVVNHYIDLFVATILLHNSILMMCTFISFRLINFAF